MNPTSLVRIGVVTVSDRASRGEYQDLGGPAIRAASPKSCRAHGNRSLGLSRTNGR